jgi:NAD(P)-dependent dehydrogenase (short-subunit alcohol dehydrogenase family)
MATSPSAPSHPPQRQPRQEHTVIMGGSSGLGLATAQRLAAAGMKVTITGRSRDRLTAARADIAGEVDAIELDACDTRAVHAFFEQLGRFDHLVLALGSGRGFGPFATLDLGEVLGGFEDKALSHLKCAQAAIASIRGDGSITFITAVSAQMAAPGTAGLAAINGALSCAIPVLAVELRPLRVNAVSPGVIATPWWNFLPDDQREAAFASFAGKTPVGRVGLPDDIAKAIAFLVDDSFMTGHVLVCDGGLRLSA